MILRSTIIIIIIITYYKKKTIIMRYCDQPDSESAIQYDRIICEHQSIYFWVYWPHERTYLLLVFVFIKKICIGLFLCIKNSSAYTLLRLAKWKDTPTRADTFPVTWHNLAVDKDHHSKYYNNGMKNHDF